MDGGTSFLKTKMQKVLATLAVLWQQLDATRHRRAGVQEENTGGEAEVHKSQVSDDTGPSSSSGLIPAAHEQLEPDTPAPKESEEAATNGPSTSSTFIPTAHDQLEPDKRTPAPKEPQAATTGHGLRNPQPECCQICMEEIDLPAADCLKCPASHVYCANCVAHTIKGADYMRQVEAVAERCMGYNCSADVEPYDAYMALRNHRGEFETLFTARSARAARIALESARQQQEASGEGSGVGEECGAGVSAVDALLACHGRSAFGELEAALCARAARAAVEEERARLEQEHQVAASDGGRSSRAAKAREIISLQCPACGTALPEPDLEACLSMTCPKCGTFYCGICRETQADTTEGHAHVRSKCAFNSVAPNICYKQNLPPRGCSGGWAACFGGLRSARHADAAEAAARKMWRADFNRARVTKLRQLMAPLTPRQQRELLADLKGELKLHGIYGAIQPTRPWFGIPAQRCLTRLASVRQEQKP